MAQPFESLSQTMTNSLSATGTDDALPQAPDAVDPYSDDRKLLTIFERLKKESFDNRWIWEREWLRDIFYTINRQWIYYHPTRREWVDKRLNKNVPRPTTNKIAEIVQALKSNFGDVDLGVVARPIGHNPQSVATAEIVDKLAPLIHDEHRMRGVMRDADFWFIVTGNACLQISWDMDKRHNRVFIAHEACQMCGLVSSPATIIEANNMCPGCGGAQFGKATDPLTGKPAGEWRSHGKGHTRALSPFEYAFPHNITHFEDVPYIIRLRWRDKHYYEANHPDLLTRIVWETTPADRSLQILKSLAYTNDLATGSAHNTMFGASGTGSVEGVTEYELWMKPTDEFPEGLVMRVIGEKNQILLRTEEEAIPGPIPFKDKEGMPLFPFSHAAFEQIGGRLYGRSALAPLIQKQDQLNQLDSLIQMIVQRMANPVWVVPEGAGLDHFTGDPGLVMKWNPLAAGGSAKPERIAGEQVPTTLFQLRAQHLQDLEELSGTFDILKGQRPQGVSAFSTMQLLVERSQARFTSAFHARGEMYRTWFNVALELERAFGPQERVISVLSPNHGYTFETFQKASLTGNVNIHIEDGTDMPKTGLGKRAAIEHANQLRLLTPEDPEQKYAILSQLGLSDLVPSLDVHVQAALQMQDAFERWMASPEGPPPLNVKPWYNPQIHWGERIKWLNGDTMRDAMQQFPEVEQVIQLHLEELNMAMMPMLMGVPTPGQPNPPAPPGPGVRGQGAAGGGQSMDRSNSNSGSPTIEKSNPAGERAPK